MFKNIWTNRNNKISLLTEFLWNEEDELLILKLKLQIFYFMFVFIYKDTLLLWVIGLFEIHLIWSKDVW